MSHQHDSDLQPLQSDGTLQCGSGGHCSLDFRQCYSVLAASVQNGFLSLDTHSGTLQHSYRNGSMPHYVGGKNMTVCVWRGVSYKRADS